MPNPNLPAANRIGVLGAIDPDANGAGTLTTAWIPAVNYKNFMAVIMSGDLGTNATIAAKLEQATSAAGAGAKDITGKAITTMTQAVTDTSNRQRVINLRQGELDVVNSFTHFRLSFTTAVATSDSGAVVLGLDPIYGPATTTDATTVDEVIA